MALGDCFLLLTSFKILFSYVIQGKNINYLPPRFPATLILFSVSGNFSLPSVPPGGFKIDVCRFAFNLVSFDRLWLSESNNTPRGGRAPDFPPAQVPSILDSPQTPGKSPVH